MIVYVFTFMIIFKYSNDGYDLIVSLTILESIVYQFPFYLSVEYVQTNSLIRETDYADI